MNRIGPEIRRLMDVGDLTVADIARWFNVPRSTVNGWVNNGVAPHRAKHFDLWLKITSLRVLVTKTKGGAIPEYIRSRRRKAYLIRLRDRQFKQLERND